MIAPNQRMVSPAGSSVAERWEIDPGRSSLTFRLRHIVVQKIAGRFDRWGGTIFINRREPWQSAASIWVDLTSITTDDPERDAHVRSPEFLDAKRFPRAEFNSTAVWVDERRIVIRGRLDLHGCVRDVEIHASALPLDSERDGGERSRYRAQGALDRQSFALHWNQDLDVGGVVVGDEVEIEAAVELVRARDRAEVDA